MTDTALRLRRRSPASLAGGDGGSGAGEGGKGGGAEEEAVFNFPLVAKHRDAFVAAVAEVAAAQAFCHGRLGEPEGRLPPAIVAGLIGSSVRTPAARLRAFNRAR